MDHQKHWDIELEQFKTEINLVEFACNRFSYTVDAKWSSPNSIVLRKGEGEKLIVTRDLDGHYVYFAVKTPYLHDFGSIIDLIQTRMKVTLGEVRIILRSYQGTPPPQNLPQKTSRLVKKIKPVNKDILAVVKEYESFSELSDSAYLETRGLKKETYTSRRFTSKIRVDAYGNLIFPHFDQQGICGFERKNKDFKGFSRGGKKAIWSSNRYASDDHLVITESVIDALSYHATFGTEKTRYASTSGAFSETTQKMIFLAQNALPKANGTVILAYDNDAEGDKYRRATSEILKGSGKQIIDHRPQGKDFNEDLQKTTLC